MRTSYVALFALLTASAGVAPAAVITQYNSLGDFTTALGGAGTQTQDFSGFAVGTDLTGVSLVPGVTATTGNDELKAFSAADRDLFSSSSVTRTNPAYVLDIGNNYNSFGFDIRSWDPNVPGSIVLTIAFADSTSQIINLTRPVGVVETDPQFFGIISNVGITSIRLDEPPELPPSDGTEEVGLDNLIAANVSASVPEPSSVGLVTLGLGGLALLARKRRAQGN